MTLDRSSSTDSFLWQACPKTFRYASIAPRAFEVLGYLPESLAADPDAWQKWVHRGDAARLRDTMLQIVADGVSRTCEHRAVTADGRVIDVSTTAHRMLGSQGVLLAGITEIARPSEGSEASLALLLECGKILDSGGEVRTLFQSIADRLTETFTDWAFIDIANDTGFERVAIGARLREKLPLAESISKAFPLDYTVPVGPAKVVATGKTDYRPDIPDWVHDSLANESGQQRLISDLKLRSRISVPIPSAGRVAAVLTVATADSDRRHRRSDIAVLEDLGRRMGICFERTASAPPLPPTYARLSSRQKEVLALVAAGAPSAEIAKQLGLSVRTVETHRTKILRRLGLRGPIDVANFAFKYRLLNR